MEYLFKEPAELDPIEEDLEFQITDLYVPEADKAEREINRGTYNYDEDPKVYDIYMFGKSADGHSVCAKVTGFEPYFFVKPPASWGKNVKSKAEELKNSLLEEKVYNPRTKQMRNIIPYRLRSHFGYIKVVMRKDFWGFTNGQNFPFLKIKVKSLALFNILKRHFESLASDGFKLYESNIDPFLRFLHERDIQPCGWVRLPAGTYDWMPEDDNGNAVSRAAYNVQVNYSDVYNLNINRIAPLVVMSFDLECTSSHGDFPIPKKNYRKLAMDLVAAAKALPTNVTRDQVKVWICEAFKNEFETDQRVTIHKVYPKKTINTASVLKRIEPSLDDIHQMVVNAAKSKTNKKAATTNDVDDEVDDEALAGDGGVPSDHEQELIQELSEVLPPLHGDPIIQIGTTVHVFGSDEILYRHIATLKSCDSIEGADVESYDTEEDMIQGWKDLLVRVDPDILTGYNIFGFDMDYLWSRVRELQMEDAFAVGLGRLNSRRTTLLEQRLESSALGVNILKYIDLDGIVTVDMFKVMQRDQKLDSYKLDHVAQVFLGDKKDDLKPNQIFERYQGDASDRCVIAKYCLQDCALVNRLMHKLKVLENNIGMGNVCSVPLSYLFMRGQGVKIFSLVAKECRSKQYLIPVLKGTFGDGGEDTGGYEGAIVLEPKEGIYLQDPITVLDYSSLYPSSMIARNLSHDCFVNNPDFANLESKGITYTTVKYDVYEGVGDKKTVVGTKECTFAQLPKGQKGIIPSILQKLLQQRKNTRKKIEYERLTLSDGRVAIGLVKEMENGELEIVNVDQADLGKGFGGHKAVIDASLVVARKSAFTTFEQAVLDALQLAFKVTANSLYGQIGSRTSPIYWKDIAACTTATGREMIMTAKNFVEKEYGAEVIYGDTDSIFVKFPNRDSAGKRVYGKEALPYAIQNGQKTAREIKPLLPPPQSLEYEKTFYPFIIFSKKRYVGNLYEDDPNKKPKQKSMGIVLKRRDNAPIVKHIYGGIIDTILNKNDIQASVEFLQQELQKLVDGKFPLEDLVITKTLKAEYKDPLKIAHKVLADRMGLRDPGNKPASNDRIPFVYIRPPPGTEVKLQGDRIEHPEYIREQSLTPDYKFYITNQLQTPISQLYALCVEELPQYTLPPEYWEQMDEEMKDHRLYSDPKKRKDRITALRMKEVVELLFEPFLCKLEDVMPKRKASTATTKARKNKTLTPVDDTMPVLKLGVTENKEKKCYECTAQLVDNKTQAVLLDYKNDIPKKQKVTSKQYAFRMTAEKVLNEIHKAKKAENTIRIHLEDKTFARTWRQALETAAEMRSAMLSALENKDIGLAKEMQDKFTFLNLVDAMDIVPYTIST